MNDVTLKQLSDVILRFREERDWRQFHNAKDQVLSLMLEAAELLELVQWRNGVDLDAHLSQIRERVGEELCDILGWVLLIAHDQQIDFAAAFERKMDQNRAKYPIDKCKGSAKKYDEI